MSNEISIRISAEGVEKTASGFGLLADKLGGVARIAGGLVLAPQFVGGLKNASVAMFEASAAAERLRVQLSFSTANAEKELGYLTRLTGQLGLEFRGTAQAYAGFSSAARGTALEGQKARDVFEAISKASAVMGLSTEQSSGALLAIQQMMSKGVVSAEEFRGQLGERMPIALQAGAKALGVTSAEFSKLMESGKIVSEDFLPKFASAISEMLGDAPERAAARLDAATNRMLNSWERLKQAGGDSGIARALAADMNTLSTTATVMAEAMEQSSRRGDGALLQLANAAGALIGRSALGGLAEIAGQVNSGVNLLTGGVLNLSTNITLLPENLRPSAEQLALIEKNLKTAKSEYDALADRVKKAPENIYLKSELSQLGKYIAGLEEARRQKKLLVGSEEYGNEGRGALQQKTAADAELAASRKRAEAYARLFEKYATPAEKTAKALREAREELGEFLTIELENRIRNSTKAASDSRKNDTAQAFAAEIKMAQDHSKTAVEIINEKVRGQVISERAGIQQTLGIQQRGYSEQATLLKKQLEATPDKGDRDLLRAQIVALGNDAAAAAEKAASGIARIDLAAADARAKSLLALTDEAAVLEEKATAAEAENDRIGITAERLADLTEARHNERITLLQDKVAAIEALAGRNEEVAAIERQISAIERLKNAEVTKPKLQAQAREWENFTRDIERSLTDSLYRGLEKGGKDGAKLARDTITNSLKAIPLKLFVQAVINPVMNGAQQVLGIGGGNGAAGSVGSLASLYNAYSSWSNAGGVGGLGTTAGNWFGQAFGNAAYAANTGAYAQGFSAGLYGGQGMAAEYSKYALEMSNSGNYAAAGAYQQAADAAGQGAAQGSSLSSGLGYAAAVYALTQGQYGQAVGTAIGTAIMPGIGTAIGSTLGGLVDSFTSSGGAPKSMVGGGGRITASGVDYNVSDLPHWTDYTAQSQQLASSIVTDQLVTALQKINTGYTAGAFVKGEINAKGSSSNQGLAQVTDAAGNLVYHNFKEEGKGVEDYQKFVADQIPKLQLALVVDAMRSAGGEIKGIADELLNATFKQYAGDDGLINDFRELTSAVDSMDASQVAAFTASLQGLVNIQDSIKTSLGVDASAAALVGLSDLSGGVQNFAATLAAYTDSVLSDTQKQDAAQRQLSSAFERLGLPVAQTTEELHKLVLAQDYTTEAGQRTALSLMQLAPTLKTLSETAETAAVKIRSAAEIAAERAGLESKIDQLTGNTAAIRERELAALDPSNRALQERIWSLEAEATAAQAATEIANQRLGLQNTLDQLLDNTAAIRGRELAALAPANRALQQQIYAIQDAKAAQDRYNTSLSSARTALESAASAVQAAESTVSSIRETGTSNYLSALSNVESAQQRIADLQIQTQAEAARTAQAAIDKFRDAGKTLRDFLVGENGTSESRFSDVLKQALAGDSDAMSKLPDAARAAMVTASEASTSAFSAALARGTILADVQRAQRLAAERAAQVVADPGASDPAATAAAATAALAKAQSELADALRVAQTIGAPLQKVADDLIAKYNAAQAGLEAAIVDRDRAQAALNAIQLNTANTVTAVGALDISLSSVLTSKFDVLDTSLDGLLDYNEFRTGLAGLATDAELRRIYGEIDVNGDGQISKLEAIRYGIVTSLAGKFDVLDTSLDGLLDYNEFRTGLAGLATDAELRRIYGEIDVNGDGQISKLEAIRAAAAVTAINTSATGVQTVTFSASDPLRSIFDNISSTNSELKRLFGMVEYNTFSSLAVMRGIQWEASQISGMAVGNSGGIRVKFDRGGYTSGVYAKGGVFTNSVVSSPTYFDRSLMGEAGPEAIMPLRKMPDGSLGVHAQVSHRPLVIPTPHAAGDNSEALALEIQRLRSDAREQARVIVELERALLKLLERWDRTGLPETREMMA